MANAILFKVKYVTNTFDLTAPEDVFQFIFQIYNFVSVAKADNKRLDGLDSQFAEVAKITKKQNLPAISKRKKEENNNNVSKRARPNPGTSAQGGQEDSLDNPSVQRAVTNAGYTPTPPIPKELTPLFPVSFNSRRCTRYLI
jgi:hypothetical protein